MFQLLPATTKWHMLKEPKLLLKLPLGEEKNTIILQGKRLAKELPNRGQIKTKNKTWAYLSQTCRDNERDHIYNTLWDHRNKIIILLFCKVALIVSRPHE